MSASPTPATGHAEGAGLGLTALRHPAVAGANVVMFVSGIAMYLLFTLITRFVQTPSQAGYGYGLTEVEAGLVLVPFSVLGFVAGRVTPKMRQKVSPFGLLTANGVVIALACVLFGGVRGLGVVWPIVVMGRGIRPPGSATAGASRGARRDRSSVRPGWWRRTRRPSSGTRRANAGAAAGRG